MVDPAFLHNAVVTQACEYYFCIKNFCETENTFSLTECCCCWSPHRPEALLFVITIIIINNNKSIIIIIINSIIIIMYYHLRHHHGHVQAVAIEPPVLVRGVEVV